MMNTTLTTAAAIALRNDLGLFSGRSAWDASGHSMCRSFATGVSFVNDAGATQRGSMAYVTDDGVVGILVSYSPLVVVERHAAEVTHRGSL